VWKNRQGKYRHFRRLEIILNPGICDRNRSFKMAKVDRRTSGIAPGGVYLDTSEKGGRIRSANSSRPQGPPIVMENSYQLEPTSMFPITESKNIIREVLHKYLDDKIYNQDECTILSTKIADEIKALVKKSLKSNRYKIVSYVVIGQTDQATINLASRCIWNDKFDTRAEGTFKSSTLYAVAMVYGLYLE